MSMPTQLTDKQADQVKAISELECRRYFDHYLANVFPEQVKAIRVETKLAIAEHDGSPDSHGAVEKKLNKMILLIMGVAGAGGGVGALAAKLMEAFAGQ